VDTNLRHLACQVGDSSTPTFFSNTFINMVSHDGPLDGGPPRRYLVPGVALLVAQELLSTHPLGTSLDQWFSYIEGLTHALAKAHVAGADDAPAPPAALLLDQEPEPPAPHLCVGRAGCALHGDAPAVGTINRRDRGWAIQTSQRTRPPRGRSTRCL
jgi:hypothetical protein